MSTRGYARRCRLFLVPFLICSWLSSAAVVASPSSDARAPSLSRLTLSPLGRGLAWPAQTPAWERIHIFKTPTCCLAAAGGLDGRIYAIGGKYDPHTVLTSVLAYTPATNTWTAAASLPVPRLDLASVTGLDGRIYAIGGCDLDPCNPPRRTVFVYTPATNTWTSLPGLRIPRAFLSAAVGLDGRIYAIGGMTKGGRAVASVEVYTPGARSWTFVASLPAIWGWGAAATGPDGRVYAIGGSPGQFQTITTVEAYDPRANAWTQVAGLSVSRCCLAAATGPDGRIYAIGGIDHETTYTTVEAYTPAVNQWTLVASLQVMREDLAAAAGRDGRLYALGGYNTTTRYQRANEVYGPAITLTPSHGPAGSSVALAGSNFAAQATVRLYWGTVATGTFLATGSTDASGALTTPITFTVPTQAGAGTYPVTAVDSVSAYPVNTLFAVP